MVSWSHIGVLLFLIIPLLVLAHEPLRVSLEDLHSTETKGKWWLVGAAWDGDPLVDKQAEFTKKANPVKEKVAPSNNTVDLVQIARSQGMNTDIRRSIFVVLMSSEVLQICSFPPTFPHPDSMMFAYRTTWMLAKDSHS